MAKKDKGGFINFDDLDPDVSGAIGESRRKRDNPRLTPAQRRKLEQDRARNRRMVDIPPELDEQLEEMAAALGVPVSSLITWLLFRSLDLVSIEELEAARELTRSMRWNYVMRYTKK